MQFFSVFLHTFWSSILYFSLLFPFFRTPSLFSWHSMVCLSFKFSFTILHFLVSSSFSFLFSCSSMVDYSSIRVDCPLIAFLFACLGCLLEAFKGKCLKWVSLFMGEDCLHKFDLSSLFPLVFHSARVARSLKMSEVRSSDLDTGLSSSDNHVIPEVTSPSTPYIAWNIPCALSRKDEKQIRDRFQFPNFVKIRIPSDKDRAYHSYTDEVCFYEVDFTSGLRFSFIPLLGNFLHIYILLQHN